MIERIKIMFIKLLIGPAASGKSTYIENHKSENDIIAFTCFDQLIIRNQNISHKFVKLGITCEYHKIEDNCNIKHLIKDDFNGEIFVKMASLYTQHFNNELTLWIESRTISQEAIQLLKKSYKHRFKVITFPQ